MAKFNFRFEEILELKKNIENQKQMELANINQKIIEEKEKFLSFNQKLEKLFDEMKLNLVGTINMTNLNAYYSQIAYYINLIEQQKIFINELEKQQQIKKNELIKTMQERKAFEILKDKQHEQWKKEIVKKEQKFLDFVGLIKKYQEKRIINEIN